MPRFFTKLCKDLKCLQSTRPANWLRIRAVQVQSHLLNCICKHILYMKRTNKFEDASLSDDSVFRCVLWSGCVYSLLGLCFGIYANGTNKYWHLRYMYIGSECWDICSVLGCFIFTIKRNAGVWMDQEIIGNKWVSKKFLLGWRVFHELND